MIGEDPYKNRYFKRYAMLLFVAPEQEPVPSTAPLFTERCPAGFPSPAADYTEEELDLNAYCIRRPAATFFVRAIGDSMKEMGLHSGDLMVVDKAEKPLQGDIVIAETDGEFTVKRLQLTPRIALLPMNPAYPTLYPEDLQIFGVVTAFIHKTRGMD
nr:Error-prone repair protein UmuD [Klebsiella pneumoniae]